MSIHGVFSSTRPTILVSHQVISNRANYDIYVECAHFPQTDIDFLDSYIDAPLTKATKPTSEERSAWKPKFIHITNLGGYSTLSRAGCDQLLYLVVPVLPAHRRLL